MIRFFDNLSISKNDLEQLINEWTGEVKSKIAADKSKNSHSPFYGIEGKMAKQQLTWDIIIKADISKMETIKTTFQLDDCEKEKMKNLYTIMISKYSIKIISTLKLSVCPYCNRNFINIAEQYSGAQFDHFFCKSKYPILSVSFYNLIPSCYFCNHTKGEQEISFSPYEDVNTDNLLTFSYQFNDSGDEFSDDNYEIIIKEKDMRIKKNIQVFKLVENYQLHKDLLIEIKRKAQYYNKNRLNDIRKLFGNLSDCDFDRLIWGNYLSKEEYYKRPLSKFTHDIVESMQK